MAEIFGATWVNQYGDVPQETWRQALAQLSDEEIRHGLQVTVETPSEFPPNLTLFLDRCRSHTNANNPREVPMHKWLPSDPPETEEHRAARKARGRERMAEVWAALRGRA